MFAPDMKGRLDNFGVAPVASTPSEFAAFIDREIALYAKIIKAGKIKPQ